MCAARRYSSRGKVSASSQAFTFGAISAATKARTLARKLSCSALKPMALTAFSACPAVCA